MWPHWHHRGEKVKGVSQFGNWQATWLTINLIFSDSASCCHAQQHFCQWYNLHDNSSHPPAPQWNPKELQQLCVPSFYIHTSWLTLSRCLGPAVNLGNIDVMKHVMKISAVGLSDSHYQGERCSYPCISPVMCFIDSGIFTMYQTFWHASDPNWHQPCHHYSSVQQHSLEIGTWHDWQGPWSEKDQDELFLLIVLIEWTAPYLVYCLGRGGFWTNNDPVMQWCQNEAHTMNCVQIWEWWLESARMYVQDLRSNIISLSCTVTNTTKRIHTRFKWVSVLRSGQPFHGQSLQLKNCNQQGQRPQFYQLPDGTSRWSWQDLKVLLQVWPEAQHNSGFMQVLSFLFYCIITPTFPQSFIHITG